MNTRTSISKIPRTGKKIGCARLFLTATAVLLGLCVVLAALSALYNRIMPTRSSVVDRLSDLDKARLAEVIHLRQERGETVLPGWSQAEIPVILYNEEYLFLVGLNDPLPGWQTVPGGRQMGTTWQAVPADDFLGRSYYRQEIANGQTSQAFTVQVGTSWAASMTTLEWTRLAMTGQIRSELPGFAQPLVPVHLFVNLLMPDSDTYISTILHESIHAYQGMRAPDRLAAAERVYNTSTNRYPYHDETFAAAWQKELDLLYQSMHTANDEDAARLAREFLHQREARRKAANLSNDLLDLERLKEWEEGIAKYGERVIYLEASRAPYQPSAAITSDSEFQSYQGAQSKWDQEVEQLQREARAEGDGRFYYTGFAQAVLLDRLSPGWKDRLFDDGVWLEELLFAAVNQ